MRYRLIAFVFMLCCFAGAEEITVVEVGIMKVTVNRSGYKIESRKLDGLATVLAIAKSGEYTVSFPREYPIQDDKSEWSKAWIREQIEVICKNGGWQLKSIVFREMSQ